MPDETYPIENPILLVEWYDHYGNDDLHSWVSRDEVISSGRPQCVIRTYGELVWEDAQRLCLVSNMQPRDSNGEAAYSTRRVIYKKLIIRRIELGKKEVSNGKAQVTQETSGEACLPG